MKFKNFIQKEEIIDFTNETPEQTALRNAANFKWSQNKSIYKVQKYFKFDSLGSTFKKEIIGGTVTFLSLVYILTVNPSLLSGAPSITDINGSIEGTSMNYFGIFFATALASFIGTFAMGLFANVPVAVSTSMGMNVMFVFNIAKFGGVGYEGALIATMISSIIFVILSITPLRSMVIKAIPKELILAIGVSIGLFIAYVGLNDMGWFKQDGGLPVASFSILKDKYPLILIGMFTLGIILFLHYKKIPGGVAIGIGIGFIISIILANSLPGNNWLVMQNGGLDSANFRLPNHGWIYDFNGFASNIKNTWTQFTNVEIWNKPVMYISIFIVMFMNFFDATGTLATFNLQLNKRTNQHHHISDVSLVVDSASTVVAAALGTSSLGTFVESSAGIEQGSRTGFSAIITSLFFLSSIALFPIFKAIPRPVSAAACVYIGIIMISEMTEIKWKKPEFAVATFFTMIFMITTYAIANGIAMGFIFYTFIMVITNRSKQVPIAMWPLSILFIGYIIATAFIQ